MKKIILFSALLALFVPRLEAQPTDTLPAAAFSVEQPAARYSPPRHNIRFGVAAGALTIDGMGFSPYEPEPYYRSGDVFTSALEESRYTLGDKFCTPTFVLTYGCNIVRWFDITCSATYAHGWQSRYSTFDGHRVGRKRADYFSVIASARFTWVCRRYVRLYSSVGFGVGMSNGHMDDDTRSVSGAMHLTFVGVEAGGRLYGYTEIGVGFHGILSAGIGYKFNGGGKR